MIEILLLIAYFMIGWFIAIVFEERYPILWLAVPMWIFLIPIYEFTNFCLYVKEKKERGEQRQAP